MIIYRGSVYAHENCLIAGVIKGSTFFVHIMVEAANDNWGYEG